MPPVCVEWKLPTCNSLCRFQTHLNVGIEVPLDL